MSEAKPVARDRLIPCPVCGGVAGIEETQGGGAVEYATVYRGGCRDFGCTDEVWTSVRQEAVDDWNKQARAKVQP